MRTNARNAPVLAGYRYSYDRASNLESIRTPDGERSLNFTVTNAIAGGTYDSNGNPLGLGGKSYQWDAENRLIRVTAGQSRSDFVYDGQSRLVRIVDRSNGKVLSDKSYLWCGLQRCVERNKLEDSAAVSKRYYSQGESHGENKYHYTWDHLRSVRQLVSASGVIRAQYSYDPYGDRRKLSGRVDSDYGYAGLLRHSASGLDFAVYRAYDSPRGRWLNRDPIRERGGLNLYRYGDSNPLNREDTTGLNAGLLLLGSSGAVIAAGGTALILATMIIGPIWAFCYLNNESTADTSSPHTGPVGANGPDTKGSPDDPDEDELFSNPKHHPNSNSPEPKNVRQLYETSVRANNGTRWAQDSDGVLHRFSPPSNGRVHWNGSTGGAGPIKLKDVPSEIRKIFRM